MKGGFYMYSAKEAAKITGLSTATLRYYEKEKLLPQIARTAQKYRQYSVEDIEWIKMIQCLRMANVPIHSVKQYVSLLKQGGKTLTQRYELVLCYKNDIEKQMLDLKRALDLTENKLMFYEELLKEPVNTDMTYLEEWHLFKNGGKKKE